MVARFVVLHKLSSIRCTLASRRRKTALYFRAIQGIVRYLKSELKYLRHVHPPRLDKRRNKMIFKGLIAAGASVNKDRQDCNLSVAHSFKGTALPNENSTQPIPSPARLALWPQGTRVDVLARVLLARVTLAEASPRVGTGCPGRQRA